MDWLRHLFWLSAVYNFHITARHIVGVDNVISDTLSRIEHIKSNVLLSFILSQGLDLNIDDHMSIDMKNYLIS